MTWHEERHRLNINCDRMQMFELMFARIICMCSTPNQFTGQIFWSGSEFLQNGTAQVYGFYGDPSVRQLRQLSRVGCVNSDGSLTLELPTAEGEPSDLVHVTSAEDALLSGVVANRGGGIELRGTDARTLKRHAVRLYMVIAADTSVNTGAQISNPAVSWVHPAVSFAAFLCGNLTRETATTNPIQQLPQPVLQIVHSFIKFKPDWSRLERLVEKAGLHLPSEIQRLVEKAGLHHDNVGWGPTAQTTPESLVNEYRIFLSLKIAAEDWTSKILSPSVFPAPNGKKLVDEVRTFHVTCNIIYITTSINLRCPHQISTHHVIYAARVPQVWHLHLAMDC
eukprot:COSAG01_NODE_2037_length_8579_cov_119.860849_5_plen_337_part_00